MAKFLTFDLGTTLYKVALFDEAGRVVALQQLAPPIAHPRDGWWELETDVFKRVLDEAVEKLRVIAGDDWADVVACSFATQANSFTLLDQRNRPLIPFILWPDQRATGFEDELKALAGMSEFSGMPRLSTQLAAAKYLWLRRNRLDLFPQAQTLCFLSDYLTLWLTGKLVSEGGVAGLSGLSNIETMQWSQPAHAYLGLPATATSLF